MYCIIRLYVLLTKDKQDIEYDFDVWNQKPGY